MALIKPQNYWEQIPKSWLRDSRLGFKELGILCKLQSLPTSWEFSIQGLAAIMKDGTDSIRSGIRNLEEMGYLTRQGQKRDDDGHYSGGDWVLHEDPFDKENPMGENTTSESQPQIEKERNQELKNDPMPDENPSVVRVEKWDFDSKGIWKRKRTVYTTVEEADKIEEAEKDEYVSFGFWQSPPLVGNQDKMKTMSEKKTKLKTEYPEPEEKPEKKTGGYMEGIEW